MTTITFAILGLWLIALVLGVFGVVKRRRNFILLGGVAALCGVAVTYYLKWLLQNM